MSALGIPGRLWHGVTAVPLSPSTARLLRAAAQALRPTPQSVPALWTASVPRSRVARKSCPRCCNCRSHFRLGGAPRIWEAMFLSRFRTRVSSCWVRQPMTAGNIRPKILPTSLPSSVATGPPPPPSLVSPNRRLVPGPPEGAGDACATSASGIGSRDILVIGRVSWAPWAPL
jgi:hypothetical protein